MKSGSSSLKSSRYISISLWKREIISDISLLLDNLPAVAGSSIADLVNTLLITGIHSVLALSLLTPSLKDIVYLFGMAEPSIISNMLAIA